MAANTQQHYEIEAYTEEDAIRQAMFHFKKIIQIEKIKSGYSPQKCKVMDYKFNGAKKWVTKHYIYSFDAKAYDREGKEIYSGLKLMGATDKGKIAAIKEARSLAITEMKPMTIRIVKVLEDASNVVSDVVPNDGIRGRWKITGTPRTSGVIRQHDVQDVLQKSEEKHLNV